MLETLTKQQKYPDSVQPGVPRLRNLKKGWQRKKIGDLLCEVSRPVVMDDNASYNLVTVKRARGGVVKRAKKKGKDIAVKSQFEVREGDFLISKRQIVHGACGIVPAELDGSIVSNEYSVLRCRDILDSRFLNYLTNTNYFQQTCFHSSIGVHIEKMIFKLNDWFKWKIDIPDLAEQQEIAAFVGAVDKKLEALSRKHALLQAYKRGMMQKIFSQELRFKDEGGGEFPEWEEKRFGEIAIIQMGQSPDSSSYNDSGIGVPLIQGNADLTNGLTNPRRYTSEPTKLCEEGSIIISVRAPVGELALSIHRACIGRGVCSIRARKHYSNIFLFQWLLWFEKQWIRVGQGSTFTAISGDDIRKLKILIPVFDEQQKIANFLSAIDSKIDAVAEQIERTKQFKKGLLQQMFV